MTITIPSGRTLPLQAKSGGGFESAIEVGSGSGSGSASGSGIDVSWTGKEIGETVTISTSTLDFTTKANAAPFWYVDPGAEGTINASPLSRMQTSLSGRALGNLDTVTKHGPNGSARASLVGTAPPYRVGSGSLGPTGMDSSSYGAGDHLRIITRWRRNFDGADAYAKWLELASSEAEWNIKRWRWWSNSPTFRNNVWVGGGQSTSPDGNVRIAHEGSATGTFYPSTADDSLYGFKKDTWISEIIDIRQSSAPGVADGRYKIVANGQEVSLENTITLDDDGSDEFYKEIVMEQWQFIYTDVPFILWHDHIYVDDTPHALIVSDKPNWTDLNATMDPLIPTAWSATEITAKARCSLVGRYLYVIDGTGSVLNASGVAL